MNTRSLYWLIYMSICCCAGWAQAEGVPVLYGDDRSLSERDQSRLVMNHTVVALGQFLQLPNEHANENLFDLREITTIFRVDELFRGPDARMLDIKIPSDMFAYPGESISRYKKRAQLANQFSTKVNDVREQLRTLKVNEGKLSQEDYQSSKIELEKHLEMLGNNFSTVPKRRRIGAIHLSTFYNAGGVIQPNLSFLIGLDPDDNGDYTIGEVMESNIFWGAKALEIAEILRTM